MTDPDQLWLTKIKETMAIDVQRFVDAGLPPKVIVARLFEIPEVEQAFRLRANRRQPLPLEPSTDAERMEVVEALERVAAWLNDDFHGELVEQLRAVAAELSE